MALVQILETAAQSCEIPKEIKKVKGKVENFSYPYIYPFASNSGKIPLKFSNPPFSGGEK